MSIPDACAKLASALPKDHPVVKEVVGLLLEYQKLEEADNIELVSVRETLEQTREIAAANERVIDVLEDWRRGIRDWAEVEDALKDAGFTREATEGR